jgi:hypothetical protein
MHSDQESDYGEEYGTNDKFLEELERENQMLEKELENLVHMKNQALTDSSSRSKLEDYQSGESRNLQKIVEQNEEDHESYCYSNSDDEFTGIIFPPFSHFKGKKGRRRHPKEKEHEEIDIGSEFASPEIKIQEIMIPNNNQTRASRTLKYSPPKTQDSIVDDESPEHSGSKLGTSSIDNPKDKENQGPTNNSSSKSKNTNTNNSVQRSSSGNRKKSITNSPPKYEKMDKVQSLEYRLTGANKAIKALEKDLK